MPKDRSFEDLDFRHDTSLADVAARLGELPRAPMKMPDQTMLRQHEIGTPPVLSLAAPRMRA